MSEFTLPPLPYAYDALQPAMSSETLHLHHDKHHARYFEVTNDLLKDKREVGSLEEVIARAKADGEKKLFNNAAQAWNHSFFWNCMTPDKKGPSPAMESALAASFDSIDDFKKKFVEEGFSHFGSGWVWLAADGTGALTIVQTHDGENLLTQPGLVPLLVADLWEHAYYVDYKNDRKSFLKAFVDDLANWAFAENQLLAAKGQAQGWSHP